MPCRSSSWTPTATLDRGESLAYTHVVGHASHNVSLSFMSTQTGNGTQAIDRAAELLVRLIESDQSWSTVDLADDARLPKSTASRLLRALERHELVQRDPQNGT